MLESYSDLVKIDVLPFCEKRKAKDDNGKQIEIPYLNWAKCKELLHEHGAKIVYFQPNKADDGGYLFSSGTFANKDGRTHKCYFVSVKIFIDDKIFDMDMPLMNGSLVVYDDTVNQLRIANSHARAFVKGVAIHTGLGFNLWVKNDEMPVSAEDDLSIHNIFSIKQRIEKKLTAKISTGLNFGDFLSEIKFSQKQWDLFLKYFDAISYVEKKLNIL